MSRWVSIVTHFSMWSVLKSPLILGNDVTNMVGGSLSSSGACLTHWNVTDERDIEYYHQ